MIKLKKNIVIAASPEKVFDVVYDTANISQIWRNVSNVHNLKSLPNGGHSFQFDYTMSGLRLNGSATDLFLFRPTHVVTRTTGGVTSTLNWTFKSLDDNSRTEVSLEIDYEVPVPLLGRLAEYVVARINENDVVYMLNRLKHRFE